MLGVGFAQLDIALLKLCQIADHLRSQFGLSASMNSRTGSEPSALIEHHLESIVHLLQAIQICACLLISSTQLRPFYDSDARLPRRWRRSPWEVFSIQRGSHASHADPTRRTRGSHVARTRGRATTRSSRIACAEMDEVSSPCVEDATGVFFVKRPQLGYPWTHGMSRRIAAPLKPRRTMNGAAAASRRTHGPSGRPTGGVCHETSSGACSRADRPAYVIVSH